MFICKPKINLITLFIVQILCFKESYNLNSILAHNTRTRILLDMELLGEISVTITVFIIGLFPRETNKIFQAIPKTLFWGTLWAFFFPYLDKNEFSRKKGLYQFFHIPHFYHHAKNPKKNNELFPRKIPNRQIN